MIYAPVTIATLNRFEHLRRCVESLEKCKGADKTEVYISVDYPPCEKYWDGYEEVRKYLKSKTISNGFRKIYLYIQEENLGSSCNFAFLKNKIKEKYDRYISVEDDVELSANFLEYTNKGLEIFETDKRALMVCGCIRRDWRGHKGDNIIMSKLCSSYGLGIWIKKEEGIQERIERVILSSEIAKEGFVRDLRKKNRALYDIYILDILLTEKKPFWNNGKLTTVDTIRSIYMYFTDNYTVLPMLGKARSWGSDGSGENMLAIKNFNPEVLYPLDKKTDFDYIVSGKIIKRYSDLEDSLFYDDITYKQEALWLREERTLLRDFHADLGYLLLFALRFNRNKAKRFYNIVRLRK